MDKPRQYRARPQPQTRTSGLRIGTYAKAPIVFTSSWILLGGLLVLVFGPVARRNWPELGPWSYGVAALVVAILGASTLIHEMAHAVVAHRAGLKITAINVTFWGGATHLATSSPTPRDRALISAAGPVSNLVLAALSYGLWQLPQQWTIWWALLAVLTFVNLFVGALNLFPAMPLDGGGLVEAGIWAWKNDQDIATRLTARISQVLGICLAIAPFLWMFATRARLDWVILLWCVILGAVMWSTGSAVRARPQSREISTDIFLPVTTIAAHRTIADLPARIASLAKAELPAFSGQEVVVIRAANGQLTGWVDPDAVAQVPRSLAPTTLVTSVSQSLESAAIITGLTTNSEHWVRILGEVPQQVPGLVIIDAGDAHAPGSPIAAVNTRRLVAELTNGDR